MTWFPDLSGCTYHGWPGDRLAVGWLDDEHDFEQGSVLPALRREIFLDRLFWAIEHRRVDQFRGYHICQLCPPSDAPLASRMTEAEHSGHRLSLGSAQIDVAGLDGTRYVAPNLVFHYIVDHQYRPPEAFIDSVIHGEFQSEPRPVGQHRTLDRAGPPVDESGERLVVEAISTRFGCNPAQLRAGGCPVRC